MKNKILLGLAASSLVASTALADVYVGVEYGAASNTTERESEYFGLYTLNNEIDNNYKDIKLKVGAGEDGGIKVQAYFSFISYDEYIFRNSSKDYKEIGVDLIKEFEVNKQFYPFIKGGMGVGIMDLEEGYYTEDRILAVSFNLGAGLSFKATDNISLLAGVDYVYRKWQDIEYSGGALTRSTADSGIKPYIGVNFQF